MSGVVPGDGNDEQSMVSSTFDDTDDPCEAPLTGWRFVKIGGWVVRLILPPKNPLFDLSLLSRDCDVDIESDLGVVCDANPCVFPNVGNGSVVCSPGESKAAG